MKMPRVLAHVALLGLAAFAVLPWFAQASDIKPAPQDFRVGKLTNGPAASSILPSTVAYTSVANTFTAAQTFTSSVNASAFFGDGSGLTGIAPGETNTYTSSKTFTSDLRVNGVATVSTMSVLGVTDYGAKSNAELQVLACPTLPCRAMSTTDYDLYSATGAAHAGDWRNSRTGVAP